MRTTGLILVTFFPLGLAAAAQDVPTLAIGSAASGAATIAPNSIASAYGQNLTTQTESATILPLPTSLAGVMVEITDSQGVTNLASLVFASPGQINFVVPAGTASGAATVKVMGGDRLAAQGTAQVLPIAPALFAVNSSGLAAAYAIRTIAPAGPQTGFAVFQCSQGSCTATPLNVGVDTPLFLELFGTGIRGSSNVSATIHGQPVMVMYAGAQGQYPGLDQVNVPITLNLRGAGLVPVVVTVDGVASNSVFIDIQ
ncbi:MAG TPA: hypothetical protein VKB88_03845 [Bryobacteraceae bacterium]|nr:hypothetical protein [Bryobacteraceae bacterium]